jgi:hypothetical protein
MKELSAIGRVGCSAKQDVLHAERLANIGETLFLAPRARPVGFAARPYTPYTTCLQNAGRRGKPSVPPEG